MTRKRAPEQQYIDRKIAEVRLIGMNDREDLVGVEDAFKGLYAIMTNKFTDDVLLRLWHCKPLTEVCDHPDQWYQVGTIEVHRRALQIERRDGRIYDTQKYAFRDSIGEMYFNSESEEEITLPYMVPLSPTIIDVEGEI
jgi:hypothetical protein